ncbi:MAG: CNP1-like family protein [Sulfuricellaceae bacterium]
MKRLWLALCLLPLAAPADWGKFEADFEGKTPWQEMQAQLPPAPSEDKLLPFYVSSATDNRFFIDSASLSIGKDGVVRYTLLIKSAQGARNLTFEGMRCATHEQKTYAFGRADGAWSKARQAKWEPIQYQDRNRHHHVLYDDFFCPGGIIIAKPEQALDALIRERPR